MRKGVKCILACLLLTVLLCGCGGGIEGKYRKVGSGVTLELKKDHTFKLSSGGVGSYKVKGDKLSLANPVVGSVHGAVADGKIIFPNARNGHAVEQFFAGTWVRKQEVE